jgi:hypothetical protein
VPCYCDDCLALQPRLVQKARRDLDPPGIPGPAQFAQLVAQSRARPAYKAFGGDLDRARPFPPVPALILDAYPPTIRAAVRKAAGDDAWCPDPACPDCAARSRDLRPGLTVAKARGQRKTSRNPAGRDEGRKAALKRMLRSGNPADRLLAMAELERKRQARVGSVTKSAALMRLELAERLRLCPSTQAIPATA